ncbi:MAG: hypothetical protein VX320_00040 [Candidatus Thermoplasmatota archaeon]|nr:hypothetical protein [Candidatus Thermoplasmatota archaeon]
MSEQALPATQEGYRAQVTRLNLILDEHIRMIQESIVDKDARDARRSIKHARSDIDVLRMQVGRLHRSIGMLHTLMRDRSTTETELVDILLTMKTAETIILRGAFDESSLQLERLVEHLLANSAALNPFIFYHFWMGVEARWTSSADHGHLLVRIENTSDTTIPGFNIKAPVPPNWRATPDALPTGTLEPGASVDLTFKILPSAMAAIREAGAPGSLQEKLHIQTGYNLSPYGLVMDCRVENKSQEVMHDTLLMPWIPPGWKAPSWPFVKILEPGSTETVSIGLELIN